MKLIKLRLPSAVLLRNFVSRSAQNDIVNDRLLSLGVETESLYRRRIKADLLMCCNILTNRVCLASNDFLHHLCLLVY